MAWKIHFNGQVLGCVNDSDYEAIRQGILTAAQNGDIAEFGAVTNGRTTHAIWTVGAPIHFEEFDESAADDRVED